MRISCNQRKICLWGESDRFKKRRIKHGEPSDEVFRSAADEGTRRHYVYQNSLLVILATAVIVLVLVTEPAGAWAWLPGTPPARSAPSRNHAHPFDFENRHAPRLYGSPQPSFERTENITEYDKRRAKIKSAPELKFCDDLESDSSDLASLREQAARLRREADSLQLALRETKEAKLQKETDKIDGWIDDLLIEATVGDGTELLKTVDQVCEVLTEDRYSAEQVLKIFRRLCDIREQESRSNCSPLMELLVDATGKLDCTERSDCPNKRWNHRVRIEQVLRKKLFARDWNMEYTSEVEEELL